MSKLIFCKFLDSEGNPRGINYTYNTEIEVSEGDYVEVAVGREGSSHRKKVLVTKAYVKPDEIPGYKDFKDKIKNITGLWVDETPKIDDIIDDSPQAAEA